MSDGVMSAGGEPRQEIEEISFGEYRFERWPNHSGQRQRLKLFRHHEKLKVQQRCLEVLEQLLDQPPNTIISEGHINQKLWGNLEKRGNVPTHICMLRDVLNDPDKRHPRFIKNAHGEGYSFVAEVDRTYRPANQPVQAPPIDTMAHVYPDWEQFDHLLGSVRRGSETKHDNDYGDLRIVTLGFRAGAAPEDVFERLLEKGVRIKILLTNPKRLDLITARTALRFKGDGETSQGAIQAIKDQVSRLTALSRAARRKKGCRGTLDLRLSDLMPCGFVAHSGQWALLGLFFATSSYGRGPMIEVPHHTVLWEALGRDWIDRWDAAVGKSEGRKVKT